MEETLPGQFALVRAPGPCDGEVWMAVCLRCDWQSGKTTKKSDLVKLNGPAQQHQRDRHLPNPT